MTAAPATRSRNNGGIYGPTFGIVTPMGNPCAEAEFSILTGAAVIAARAVSASPSSRGRLEDYIDQIGPCIDRFDRTRTSAVGFACTCYYLRGPAVEAEDMASLSRQAGAPVITSTMAIRRMAQELGAIRIALLAPYPTWLADEAKLYYEDVGLEIVSHAGLPEDLLDTRSIYQLTPDDVAECASRLDLSQAEAVLIGGTGMPSLHFVAGWTRGLPIFSSNIALAAALLDAAGTPDAFRSILAPLARWRERLTLWGDAA